MDINYSAFHKMALKIDDQFNRRINIARQTLVDESQAMLREFRSVQYGAPQKPITKKTHKKSKKMSKAETKKLREVNMTKAQNFAKSHQGKPYPSTRTPWINRTFRSARGVFSYAKATDKELTVGMYHTLPYGAYLEFARNRKYAVIEPIVRGHSQGLIDKLNSIFKG